MDDPSPRTLAFAAAAGLANVAVVLALYVRAGYPTLESLGAVALLAVTGFAVGFVPALASAHTRLISPALVVGAALLGTVALELTSPAPEWTELGGAVVVDGPTHAGSYANTWYLWLALSCYAGALEFGLRRGYGVADDRLRNLPALPLSRRDFGRAVGGFAGLVGLATALLVVRAGARPPAVVAVVLAFAVAVAAVPLAGLLRNRIYTYRWLSLLVWIYFPEGAVRAYSDRSPSAQLALATRHRRAS